MAGTFPTLAGVDIAVKRTRFYVVDKKTSSSQTEQRTKYGPGRWRYDLNITVRAWANGDEVATLQNFFDSNYGSWDSFNFTDPYDGSTKVVRFDQDDLEMEQGASGMWACPVRLIEVL